MTELMLPGRRYTRRGYGEGGAGRIRTGLADAAWAVEERVVWGTADVARAALDVLRWPFERVAWMVERHILWPLQDRTARGSLRLVGATAAAALAVAAGVAALLAVAPDGGNQAPRPAQSAAAGLSHPEPRGITNTTLAAQPVLHGAAPVFKPEGDAGVSELAGSKALAAKGRPSAALARPGAKAVSPGPAAMEQARRFADAFVLFEIGRADADVRRTFRETATPTLARQLLRRPPRLPANVEVPKAKVLNLVPGPRHGSIYTVSVSLLRVGLTSELRLDLHHSKTDGWRVTDILG